MNLLTGGSVSASFSREADQNALNPMKAVR